MKDTARHKFLDGKVQLYMRTNSPHWQCSCSIAGKQMRTSTKEESLARAKDVARDQVVAAVAAGGFGSREVVVRVNSLAGPWGRADLEAWVEWLFEQATVSPDFTLRGVVFAGPTDLTVGTPVTWTIGQPLVAGDTTTPMNPSLDMLAIGAPANAVLTAHLGSATGTQVGTVNIVDGVATLNLNLPAGTAGGPAYVYLVTDVGTVAIVPVNITAPPVAPPPPPALPDKDKMKGAPLPSTGVAG